MSGCLAQEQTHPLVQRLTLRSLSDRLSWCGERVFKQPLFYLKVAPEARVAQCCVTMPVTFTSSCHIGFLGSHVITSGQGLPTVVAVAGLLRLKGTVLPLAVCSRSPAILLQPWLSPWALAGGRPLQLSKWKSPSYSAVTVLIISILTTIAVTTTIVITVITIITIRWCVCLGPCQEEPMPARCWTCMCIRGNAMKKLEQEPGEAGMHYDK
nr:uncharacterized protein LOC128779164 [Desmodus rotundus]